MPERPERFITAVDDAAATVLAYAPLLRTVPRLPTYTRPALTWDIAPACSHEFVAVVRAAWARLDLRDPTQFSEAEALLFRYLRMHGLLKLHRLRLAGHELQAPLAWHNARLLHLLQNLGTMLGEALLARMAPADRARWFPMHALDVRQGRDRHRLILRCEALETLPSSLGTPIYCAPRRPTLLIQGLRRPVAFTAHAIQRMRERLVAVPDSFDSQYDVFSYMYRCHYFDPVRLSQEQPAFALFDSCQPGFVVHHYAEALLGVDPATSGYAYRLGYCPVVQDGDFWLAKTMLFPGFIGTPEYQVLYHTSLDQRVKERMLAACEDLSYAQLCTTDDFSLLRWFHTHGVPQVIPEPAGLLVNDPDPA